MNKAYNQIWDSMQVLMEAEDPDSDICNAINTALLILDQALTVVKNEKTPVSKASAAKPAKETDTSEQAPAKDSKGYVLSFPGN